jgi:hypothetical protein
MKQFCRVAILHQLLYLTPISCPTFSFTHPLLLLSSLPPPLPGRSRQLDCGFCQRKSGVLLYSVVFCRPQREQTRCCAQPSSAAWRQTRAPSMDLCWAPFWQTLSAHCQPYRHCCRCGHCTVLHYTVPHRIVLYCMRSDPGHSFGAIRP